MSLFRHNCEDHGHRFQPRYDEKPNPTVARIDRLVMLENPELARSIVVQRVYVLDVCIRCGKIVRREDE